MAPECCQPGGECACRTESQSLPDPADRPDCGLRTLPVIRGTNAVPLRVGWQGGEVFIQTWRGEPVFMDAALREAFAQTWVAASHEADAAGAVSGDG